MTAARKEQPTTVYISTEVEIDPYDLEQEGWVFVGKDGKPPATVVDEVMETVQRWHDEAHELPFMWCTERPCLDLRHE